MSDPILFQDEKGNLMLSKDDLVEIIQNTVRDEMKRYKHTCRFDIRDDDVKQIERYIDTVSSLGDGELTEGMKVIEQNHQWLKETREKSSKIVNSFLLTITGAVALALVYTLFEGLKKKLGN
jgi:hypothetical protein